MKGTVISLYDYTGEAVRPWAEAGYDCFCYDIQHEGHFETVGNGKIFYLPADLHDPRVLDDIYNDHEKVDFLMAFPVCTDLAVSGAAHFAKKRAKNPRFQDEATEYAKMCANLADRFGCPFYVENPVSRLSTLWRKPDYTLHPFEFGEYIPIEEATHPKWAEYIAPRDAYSKLTCIWSGNGFIFPLKKPVECNSFGSSTQHRKLGGKSLKTKNIRSATPRGFARAVFSSNGS
tara:strand:- start:2341 stop:3036 length:696 start_codon:yes stop_codon:yes gene_type:complete